MTCRTMRGRTRAIAERFSGRTQLAVRPFRADSTSRTAVLQKLSSICDRSSPNRSAARRIREAAHSGRKSSADYSVTDQASGFPRKVRPGVAEGDVLPAARADRKIIAAVHHPFRADGLHKRFDRIRFADRRGIVPQVGQSAEFVRNPLDRPSRVTPGTMRQNPFDVAVFRRQPCQVFNVGRVCNRVALAQVEHDDQPMPVRNVDLLLGQEVR